jgi:ribosomal protein S18 acetylase RimI-like enzyme
MMNANQLMPYQIREAEPREYLQLGQMTVDIYAQLPGMPGVSEQPDYYAMLLDVAARAKTPTTEIMVAVNREDELLGGVTFIGDMVFYGSGGRAGKVADAAGIRLLAVKPECRGNGVGRALTNACIRRAGELGRSQVVLHTTRAMEIAWGLYERMGFVRSRDLDFKQGNLDVYGFRLDLKL